MFVVRMRRGSTGLYLRALAGSEVAGSSVGISPARARITAFAVCAGIAAAGGALLSMREGAANYQADFTVQFALFWLVLVVTLGSRTVEGAIVAAFALKFFPELLNGLGLSLSWQYILFGLGAIAFAQHPEGIVEHFNRASQNFVQQWLDRYQRRRGHKQSGDSARAGRGEADSLEVIVSPTPVARDRGLGRGVDDGGSHLVPDGALLELRQVRAGYGPFGALFDVSLSVPEHSVVALLGANGAGKTTIARAISGLVHIQAGSLLFDGTDIAALKAWEVARLGIVHAPEGRSVFGSLTVDENLTVDLARAVGRKRVAAGLERAYELFPRLRERRRQNAGTLSGGEQRMLSLARVLVHPPRLLVIDEPSLGLAPKVVDELYATLRHVREAGTTLLIIEQHTSHALSIAHSVVLLRHGEVIFHGGVAECGDVSKRLLAQPSS
jgi:ABC-type branched-subunit amino acid transport system ATPase component